jgi:hypothetical protein
MKLIRLFLAVLIIAFTRGVAPAADPVQEAPPEIKKGTVTGRIMVKGKEDVPLSWGQIMFYDVLTGPPPIPEKYERTPDISRNMDADGKFSVVLPEGKYYMGAVKRLSGDKLGPPQKGDYVFRSLNEKGRPRDYVVKGDQVLDVGVFTEAFPLTEEDLSKRRVTTAIEGTIVNSEWLPVEGAVVVAFVEPIIGTKPLFVSNKSGKDGKYVLPLAEGTYYLRVRNSFAAGPPEPGQIVGYYGEGTPAPVPVKECEILKGIDFQVVVFRGRGPAPQPSPKPEQTNE